MSPIEKAIQEWGNTAQNNISYGGVFLQNCVRYAETQSDRNFWETQADVISDVVAAINERINSEYQRLKNEKAD